MTDAKTYLQKIRLYDITIESKLEEINHLKALALSITSSIKSDTVAGGSNHDKIGDAIAKIIDLQREIDETIDKYVDLKKRIGDTVDQLKNADQLAVIRKRYFEYKSWEIIAIEMGYTYRNVTRIHGRALQEISEILKSCPKMS